MKKKQRAQAAVAQKVARSEFSAVIAQIEAERKIPAEQIFLAIEAGLLGAYRKQMGGEQDIPLDPKFHYWARVDRNQGSMQVFAAPRLHPDSEDDFSFDESQIKDVTPAGFGRIAAQLAKQIILQKMRDAEREQIIADYQDQVGKMVTGQVLRMEGPNVLFDLGRGNATMPPREQMRGEFYKSTARLAVLIKEIGEVNGYKTIIVSRADKRLVELLFAREVPEIATGAVQIKMIAREAGIRTKVVVVSNSASSIDPVGSCVGQRGVRVQEIIKELNNEKIDIIPYCEDRLKMIEVALSPAENLQVEFDEEKNLATVTAASDDQALLAIGRGGQNVRLAAKLLGISIKIKNTAGQVTSQATGREEYEIDSFGLDDATREVLINAKLTNSSDILRFQNRLEENSALSDEVKNLIIKKATQQTQVDEQRETPPASAALSPENKK